MNYSAAIAFLTKASSRTVTLYISQQRMAKKPRGKRICAISEAFFYQVIYERDRYRISQAQITL